MDSATTSTSRRTPNLAASALASTRISRPAAASSAAWNCVEAFEVHLSHPEERPVECFNLGDLGGFYTSNWVAQIWASTWRRRVTRTAGVMRGSSSSSSGGNMRSASSGGRCVLQPAGENEAADPMVDRKDLGEVDVDGDRRGVAHATTWSLLSLDAVLGDAAAYPRGRSSQVPCNRRSVERSC